MPSRTIVAGRSSDAEHDQHVMGVFMYLNSNTTYDDTWLPSVGNANSLSSWASTSGIFVNVQSISEVAAAATLKILSVKLHVILTNPADAGLIRLYNATQDAVIYSKSLSPGGDGEFLLIGSPGDPVASAAVAEGDDIILQAYSENSTIKLMGAIGLIFD